MGLLRLVWLDAPAQVSRFATLSHPQETDMSTKPRRSAGTPSASATDGTPRARRTAIVGAGMAGITAARTLAQAGHEVLLLDKHHSPGGRISTRLTEFGGFDHGAQFFTVTDERFKAALALQPELIAQWRVPTVRVLDTLGQALASASPVEKARWVGVRGLGRAGVRGTGQAQAGVPAFAIQLPPPNVTATERSARAAAPARP